MIQSLSLLGVPFGALMSGASKLVLPEVALPFSDSTISRPPVIRCLLLVMSRMNGVENSALLRPGSTSLQLLPPLVEMLIAPPTYSS